MQKILVTGAKGLLGVPLCKRLSKDGFNVITHSRIKNADHISDLTQNGSVEVLLEQCLPDVIIHAAAMTDVDQCEKDPQKAFAINTKTVDLISRWVQKHSNCHLVHISTDQVYDGTGPHNEDDCSPSNYYGLTKYCGELHALQCGGTVLRTNIFGHSQTEGRMSFSDWIISVLKQRKRIKLVTDVYFNPLSLISISHFISMVIKIQKPGIFNLGSRGGSSKRDFAHIIAEVLELPSPISKNVLRSDLFNKSYRPGDMTMNVEKFENAFGVKLPDLHDEILLLRED